MLVDGPGQQRRQYNLKRLALTDLKIDIARSAKKTAVLKAWQDAGVTEKFAASNWGRKLAAREKKKNLNDYERHQILMRRIKVRPSCEIPNEGPCHCESTTMWSPASRVVASLR